MSDESGPQQLTEDAGTQSARQEDVTMEGRTAAVGKADIGVSNLEKDVHWITHATFWSQVGLGLIGLVALCIYHGQLRVMHGQLDQMSRQSTQIQRQTALMHQQLVGTQAAIIGLIPEFLGATPDKLGKNFTVSMGFKNDGHVIANAVTMKLTIQVIRIFDHKPIGKLWPCDFVIPILPPTTPGTTGTSRLCHVDGFAESELAQIQALKHTVAVDGEFTYDNGFGETRTEPMCFRYIPKLDMGPKYNPDGTDSFYSCSDYQVIHDRMLTELADN